ncbi:hypothetical protein O181_114829 [Austropuccinia psidii MF-1]|uniref:Uncharacterized protein n=1 Tax=Austropuccinia psidii MF-1 TaxID=1389203 RepID=A0A9Q3K5Z6_9BASI|nr:hypothetical protein [Austropuccinia psidii MF-1]
MSQFGYCFKQLSPPFLNLTPPNPPPNSSTIDSTDSHDNSSSIATTIPDFPIDPNLGSNPVTTISPFSNMFLDSNISSPASIPPELLVTSPAMPSWVQSEILTPPLALMLAKFKINFGYHFFLFNAEINQLGVNMHLFMGTTPPTYDTFCNAHDIIMAPFWSIVLWYTYLEE